MNNNLISIILPAYNAEKYITSTINSIINQSYKYWELIIIDDCSTDKTKDIIRFFMKNDNRIKLIENSKNSGKPSICRNMGINFAQGQYIAFIDSDDMWKLKKLEIQIEFMKENNLAISFTSVEHIDAQNKVISQLILKRETGNLFKKMLYDYRVDSVTVMIDRTIYKDVFFNEEITIGEDYELFMKIMMFYKAGSLPDSLSLWRKHQSSISYKKGQLAAEDMKKIYTNLYLMDGTGKYEKYFIYLKMKIAYLYAKNFVNSNNLREARITLFEYSLKDKKFFILWFSLFFGKYGWNLVHSLKCRLRGVCV